MVWPGVMTLLTPGFSPWIATTVVLITWATVAGVSPGWTTYWTVAGASSGSSRTVTYSVGDSPMAPRLS
jgi:hypothetical protein